ncbi:RlpA-like double-psi beta-barrel domain-containing protein [Actinocrispum sp. NPDC049592]|uniref:RlpA-like double-psi beta-barrel domain-containing protein n=1 Tax=Actinocrispum sp. NPDC049592 TaxID=3154835 RepID=UPI00344555EE
MLMLSFRSARRLSRLAVLSVVAAAALTLTVPAASAETTGTGTSDPLVPVEAQLYDLGLGACGFAAATSPVPSPLTAYEVTVAPGVTDGGATPCGKHVAVTNNSNGKSTTVMVVDRCAGCNVRDLDFSPSAFSELAGAPLGRLSDIRWHFVD